MKKLTTLLTVMAMVFVMSGRAQAVPFYYTFNGTVDNVVDGAGAVASQLGLGFGIGSTVTYTFIVDFDALGTGTYNDGGTITLPDVTTSADFFYADYVSGDSLLQVDGGIYNADTDIAEYNYGGDYLNSSLGGHIFGNSEDDLLMLMLSGSLGGVANWAAGTTVNATDRAYASDGAFSLIIATVTLTDISPVNAVPEPSTLLLLASGMLGLLAFRRRQLTTQA